MKRRKKSIIFPATLATAGLVAGSLVAIHNNINAYNFDDMDLSGIANVLSEKLKTSDVQSISDALATQKLIVSTKNADALGNKDACDSLRGVLYVCSYDTVQETGKQFDMLSNNSDIDYVSLNYVLKLDEVEYSGLVDYAAHTQRIEIGEYQAWGVRTMMLDTYADSLESSSNTLRVAVLDSGINAAHLAFDDNGKARVDTTQSKNFVDTSNVTTNVADDNGHGTMVAGVIVESTPRNVTIIPIKICDSTGACPVASMLYGAEYAAQLGVDVANMSVGIKQSDMNSQAIKIFDDAFTEFTASDNAPIYVAAAGNEEANTIDYPAAAPNVIAATSVGETNQFSTEFSNHGAAADFSAPGENLTLPYYEDIGMVAFDVDGTSFSSPFIASAVANILMENPNYTQEQVEEELKLNAEDLGNPGWDEYYGHGSVSFHVNKYADIVFNSVNLPSTWGQTATVTVSASSTEYNINKYALVEGNSPKTVPAATAWKDVSGAGKNITGNYEVTKNGTYTLWYKNSNNEIKSKVFVVNSVDKDAPAIQTQISATKVSDNSQKLSIAVSDNASGLDKIEWYYKVNGGSYEKETDTYTGETSTVTKSHTLSNLAAGSYTAYAKIFDKAGNYTTSSNVTFTVEAPADHVEISTPTAPTSWIKTDASVAVTVSSNISNITHRALVEGDSTTEPASDKWTALSAPAKTVNDTLTITKNGTYTVWYKNGTESAYKTFTVNKIDKAAPTAEGLAASNFTSNSARLSLTVNDNASGVAKIEWKYKLASASEYTTKVSEYTDHSTVATIKTYTLTGLEAGNYVAFATVYDVAGNSVSSGEINFEIDENIVSDIVTINSVEVSTGWAKVSTITIEVESETSNITHFALVEGSSSNEPAASAWIELDEPSKSLTDVITVDKNGPFTVWYKNESGETAFDTFTVSKVDVNPPAIREALKAAEPVGNSVTLSISVEDAASGIAKIDWYYKLVEAESFALETEAIDASTESLTIQAATEKTHTFEDLAPGDYVAYAKITDRAGNVTTSDEVSFTIQSTEELPIADGEVENPKTSDGITIISVIGGAILAAGAFVFTKLRRIR